jgi:hypothetical protein
MSSNPYDDDSSELACQVCATYHGYTKEQSWDCDASEPLCFTCLWGKKCPNCGGTLAETLHEYEPNKFIKHYQCRWHECPVCLVCGKLIGSNECTADYAGKIHLHCEVEL